VEIFKGNKSDKKIIGYLGGKPEGELHIEVLRETAKKISSETSMTFVNVHDYSHLDEVSGMTENVILIDSINDEPSYFSLTFNIQMYYLGNAVRMGEVSGSAHTAPSIPVILEMNGAEIIEELRVIKVPYTDANNISSVDFEKGAEMVLNSIEDGSYKDMLFNNLKQSKAWNNTRIGKEYLNLFEEL